MKHLVAPLLALLCACAWSDSANDNAVARARAASMKATEAPERRESPADLMAQGDRMRDSGNVSRAAWSYIRALRLDPSKSAPRERIGFLYLTQGEPERARATFESVLQDYPKSIPALTGRGLAHLGNGNLPAAKSSLEQALALAPQSTLGTVAMGLVCDWAEQPDEARRYYERALQLDPVNHEAENNLGVSYMLSGDYARAEQHLRRAIVLDSSDAAQHNNLGLTLAELGRFDEALAAFRGAGNETAAQNNVGYMHYLKGNHAAAVQHFELALATTPADPLPIIWNLRRAQAELDRISATPDNATPAP